MQFCLNYAVLAPSCYNTQPWFFRLTGAALELFADRSRRLPVADPDGRALVIACGAALFNLRCALRFFGLQPKVTLLPWLKEGDPLSNSEVPLARVELDGMQACPASERALFQAIRRRRTYLGAFDEAPISHSLIDALQEQARFEGAWLGMLEDGETKKELSGIVHEADRLQLTDRKFRAELVKWSRRSARLVPPMPAGAEQLGPHGEFAAPFGAFLDPALVGSPGTDLIASTPLIGVLGADGDTPLDWLRSGQALQKTLLWARAAGVWASFLNQPIARPESRIKVAHLLDRNYPMLLIRFGRVAPPVASRALRAARYIISR
ncbi:MAG: nitroreductase [Proteobacteria bacterium]|nr:nitroreductase [Burkholderiales bacterium]